MSEKKPQPTPTTYEMLTAFILGVNSTARRLEMRSGINRLCEKCGRKK